MKIATALWICATLLAREPAAGILESEFAGIFTAGGSGQGQQISPVSVAGDFNGDGRPDLAILVTVSASRAEPGSMPALTITKVLSAGAGPRDVQEAQMTLGELAQRYRTAVVLLIVEDAGQTGPHAAARRYALTDSANYGKIRMSASRRPRRRLRA